MKRKIILIKWVDSVAVNGWQHRENKAYRSAGICMTSGFLVEKTDKFITVCQSLSTHCEDNYMSIPMQAVKSVRTIDTIDDIPMEK